MFRVVYSSVEVEAFDSGLLKRLLINSRLRNTEMGITGMLIYDLGVFLQMLEGDQAAVQATFRRIERDPRHRNVSVLWQDADAQHRICGEWSMGFSDASGASQMLKGFLAVEGGLRAAMLDRSNAIKILESYSSAA